MARAHRGGRRRVGEGAAARRRSDGEGRGSDGRRSSGGGRPAAAAVAAVGRGSGAGTGAAVRGLDGRGAAGRRGRSDGGEGGVRAPHGRVAGRPATADNAGVGDAGVDRGWRRGGGRVLPLEHCVDFPRRGRDDAAK